MITEYILLLLLSVVMVTVVLTGGSFSDHEDGGIQGIFTEGIPQLAIRMEKHLITGYPFCREYPVHTRPGCSWQ